MKSGFNIARCEHEIVDKYYISEFENAVFFDLIKMSKNVDN